MWPVVSASRSRPSVMIRVRVAEVKLILEHELKLAAEHADVALIVDGDVAIAVDEEVFDGTGVVLRR